jgi:hypothetical protein
MPTVTLDLTDDELAELANLLRFGWPWWCHESVEREVDDALLRASPRLWALGRLANVDGRLAGGPEWRWAWNADDPSPGSIAEQMLDENAEGWRDLDRSTFMADVLAELAVPLYEEMDARRCPATTRRGTRCHNRRAHEGGTCSIHAEPR